uniref:Uncharacterized protein n=1 Tax=Schistosoma japonicum TaxID=6182 RepID=Q5C3B8_SCHJA|nr:unknown [Schistosoma japonicum]
MLVLFIRCCVSLLTRLLTLRCFVNFRTTCRILSFRMMLTFWKWIRLTTSMIFF